LVNIITLYGSPLTFAPIRFSPEKPKIGEMPRAAWRFNQPRQALHLQTQKLVQTLSVAWRPGVCRQAVPFPEPQNSV